MKSGEQKNEKKDNKECVAIYVYNDKVNKSLKG